MHRRADDKAVAAVHEIERRVHRIVRKHAALSAASCTAAAADASADGPSSDVQKLAVNALAPERRGDLAKRPVRAALLVRTAVDEKNLHI